MIRRSISPRIPSEGPASELCRFPITIRVSADTYPRRYAWRRSSSISLRSREGCLSKGTEERTWFDGCLHFSFALLLLRYVSRKLTLCTFNDQLNKPTDCYCHSAAKFPSYVWLASKPVCHSLYLYICLYADMIRMLPACGRIWPSSGMACWCTCLVHAVRDSITIDAVEVTLMRMALDARQYVFYSNFTSLLISAHTSPVTEPVITSSCHRSSCICCLGVARLLCSLSLTAA